MNSLVCFVIFLAAALTCVAASGISSYPTAKHGPVGYHGPLAKPVVLKDGHIADTHEVAAAREAQHIALAKASHVSGGYGGGEIGAGFGGEIGAGFGGDHGVYSFGPGTGDVYKGEHGYAGLHSAPYSKHY